MRGPDWSLPFHISVNASDTTIGEVLGQHEEKKPYGIYFINRNLSLVELNYTVTENEFLAVVYAINKFHHYITRYQVFIHTNHSTIRYLINKSITNARVIRWLLLLQEFYITIIDRIGKDNVVVDFLAQLTNHGEAIPVEDHFIDEQLFSISTNLPWHVDTANYLVARKFLDHLSPQEKKRIVKQSA